MECSRKMKGGVRLWQKISDFDHYQSYFYLLKKIVKKPLIPKNAASIQIRKVATFNSDRKIINLIPNKSLDITNNSYRFFFEAFVLSLIHI